MAGSDLCFLYCAVYVDNLHHFLAEVDYPIVDTRPYRTERFTTLIAYGAAELASTAEKYQVQIDELLPNSKRVKFERSGHWSFLEERERFASVVGEFIVATRNK
jgi:pimeloyl-ACP methyl ester carboxylesterase